MDNANTLSLREGQRGTRLRQVLQQFFIVDYTGKYYCADHGRPGGNRRAPFRVRRVALCLVTEVTDPATDGLSHAVPELG